MKSRKIVSLLLTGAMTAALLAVPAQAAEAPQPYTIQATHWSREDFSQEASPEVFTGVYSRELYNAIRQTMVDGTSGTAPAYTQVSKEDYSAVKKLIGRMEGVDVSANDLSGRNGVLLVESYQTGKDQAPEATAFLKELFVPGSTK